jgi:hypothetical protein
MHKHIFEKITAVGQGKLKYLPRKCRAKKRAGMC